MIQTESYLDVADNSGARKVMCITVSYTHLTLPTILLV